MTDSQFPKAEWFKFLKPKPKSFGSSVWIPLYSLRTIKKVGLDGQPGHREEMCLVKTIAFRTTDRARTEKLEWMDFDVGEGPWADRDGDYRASEVWRVEEGTSIGLHLVLRQDLPGCAQTIWHLNQDLVLALGLTRDGDSWYRPAESFVEAVRLRRSVDPEHVTIEIRQEMLCDYLAARDMYLELATYRERTAVTDTPDLISGELDDFSDEDGNLRISTHVDEIDDSGDFVGTSVAVFTARRTDVDYEEDVPIFDQESDQNIESESYSFTRETKVSFYRVSGELWDREQIEHNGVSERIRYDSNSSDVSFVTDARGQRTLSDELNREDVGRYLWFRPTIIEEVLSIRGASLTWHTRFTGSLSPNSQFPIVFGVNEQGSINVYACDIAKLPSWFQRVFAGYSIAPSGPPSSELLAAQMECNPARTVAPEVAVYRNRNSLDETFSSVFGAKLFRVLGAESTTLRSIHRFRVRDKSSFYALAKDLCRILVDGIEQVQLRRIMSVRKDEKLGSLKLLERLLARNLDESVAGELMSPLFGLYDLRLADAHPTSSQLDSAYQRVSVDKSAEMHVQALQLFDSVGECLAQIACALAKQGEDRSETS